MDHKIHTDIKELVASVYNDFDGTSPQLLNITHELLSFEITMNILEESVLKKGYYPAEVNEFEEYMQFKYLPYNVEYVPAEDPNKYLSQAVVEEVQKTYETSWSFSKKLNALIALLIIIAGLVFLIIIILNQLINLF